MNQLDEHTQKVLAAFDKDIEHPMLLSENLGSARVSVIKSFLISALSSRDKEWSSAICKIIVQTDWANNSSEGVERLSKLSDLLAVEGDLTK